MKADNACTPGCHGRGTRDDIETDAPKPEAEAVSVRSFCFCGGSDIHTYFRNIDAQAVMIPVQARDETSQTKKKLGGALGPGGKRYRSPVTSDECLRNTYRSIAGVSFLVGI